MIRLVLMLTICLLSLCPITTAHAEPVLYTGELTITKIQTPKECKASTVGNRYPVELVLDQSASSVSGWLGVNWRSRKIHGNTLSQLEVIIPDGNSQKTKGSTLSLSFDKQQLHGVLREKGESYCSWAEASITLTPAGTGSYQERTNVFEKRFQALTLDQEVRSYQFFPKADLKKAAEQLETSFQLLMEANGLDNPVTTSILIHLVTVYEDDNQRDRAISLLEHYLPDVSNKHNERIRRTLADKLHKKAVLLQKASKFEEALTLLGKAKTLAPAEALYHKNFILTLHQLGRTQEVHQAFSGAMTGMQYASEYQWGILADTACSLKEYDVAFKYFDKAVHQVKPGEKPSNETLTSITTCLQKQHQADTLASQRSLYPKLLNNPSLAVRYGAAHALGMIGTAHVITPLKNALQNAPPGLKATVLDALFEIHIPAAGVIALPYLLDSDRAVRHSAIKLVTSFRTKEAVPALIQLLKSEDSSESLLAARGLAAIADKRSLSAMLARLSAAKGDLADELLKGIYSIGDPSGLNAVYRYLTAHIDEQTELLLRYMENEVLLEYGSKHDNIVNLMQNSALLRDEPERNKPYGIIYLAEMGERRNYLTILQDRSRTAAERGTTLLVLGRMSGQQDVELITEALRDQNSLVKNCALIALANIKAVQAAPAMADAATAISKDNHLLSRAVVSSFIVMNKKELIFADDPSRKTNALLDIAWLLPKDEYGKLLDDALKQKGPVADDVFNRIYNVLFFMPFGSVDKVVLEPFKSRLNGVVFDVPSVFAVPFILSIAGDTSALSSLSAWMIKADSEDDLERIIISSHILARYQQFTPLYTRYAKDSPQQLFHLLRRNLYLTDDIKLLTSSDKPFVRAVGHYLAGLRARESGSYTQQLHNADLAIQGLSQIEHAPYLLLACWLKAQAELKLGKTTDALATISYAEDTLQHLSRRDQYFHEELFEEFTLYLKGETLLASGKGREAVAAFEQALQGIDNFRQEPVFSQSIQSLEKMVRSSLGIAMRQVGTLQLEKARDMARQGETRDSWELDTEERGKLELVRNYLGEGKPDKAQELLEEVELRRQNFANKRIKLTLADPERQKSLEEYQKRQREIELLTRRITEEARASIGRQDTGNTIQQLEEIKRSKQKELRKYITTLKKNHPDIAAITATEPLSLKQIQEQLPENTALLQYLLLPNKLTVFVITSTDLDIVETPIDKAGLKIQVERFRALILSRSSSPELGRLSRSLYHTLLAPLEQGSKLRGITTLGIAPNGFLHYLPFAALKDEKGRYLIERYPLFSINSTSILWVAMDRAKQSRKQTALLALGNPDGTLPAAGDEVAAIAKMYPGAKLFQAASAKKQTLASQLPASSLVHLSTHGIMNPQDSSKSYLVMADGKLTIEDIWGLPLNGTSLATLSACDTGLGEILSGDDIVSLENAFIYAGAPSVVSTLWPVADTSTARLMERFYRNLSEGSGKAEALRKAQIAMLKNDGMDNTVKERGAVRLKAGSGQPPVTSWSHPYFWAPFMLRGEWR